MEKFNYNEFKKEFSYGDLSGLEYLEKTLIREYKDKINDNIDKYSYYDYIINLFRATRCLNECMFIYEQTNVKNNFNYDLYTETRDLLFKEIGFNLEDLFKEV